MNKQFRYRAFISYSHDDRPWADWLHRALESYRIPKQLRGVVGRHGEIPDRLFPIYRDRAETPAVSDLQDYVRLALVDSANLIVICSPNARRSKWVDQEILTFKRLGREQNIFAIIVDGEPHDARRVGEFSTQECFPAALLCRLDSKGEPTTAQIEPAAADAREQGDGRENAKLKLIAGLLGTDFDALRQRDLEAARRRTQLFGGIALLMAGLAVVATAASIVAYDNAQRAERATATAVVQAQTAARTTDFMIDLFSAANPEENRGISITVREMLDRGVRKLQSRLSGEDVVRSNLLRAMGQAYSGLGLYTNANMLLKAATAAAERGASSDAHLKALLALASNSYVSGHYAEAMNLYRRALSEAQHGRSANEDAVVQALIGLGDCASELNDSRGAENSYRQALTFNLQLHGEHDRATAQALNALGTQLFLDSRLDEARASFNRALAIRLALYGYRHAEVAASMSNLGSLEFDAGNYGEAERLWKKALPIYRAIYGSDHPEIATILNNVGRVELIRGEILDAKTALEQTLVIDQKFRDRADDDFILPLNSLGMIAIAQGDHSSAQHYLTEALQIANRHHHWMLNQVLGNLADLYERTGRSELAQSHLRLARESQKAQYGELLTTRERWRRAIFDLVDAALLRDAGLLGEAKALLRGSLTVLHKRFGDRGLYTHRAEALLLDVAGKQSDQRAIQSYRSLLRANPLN